MESRRRRHNTQTRDRIEHEQLWLQPFDFGKKMVERLADLDFRFREERVFEPLVFRAGWLRQARDIDPVETPSVRSGDRPQLLGRLGARRQQAAFARANRLDQELERHGRFAAAGRTFDENKSAARKSAVKDPVEPRNACRKTRGCLYRHGHCGAPDHRERSAYSTASIRQHCFGQRISFRGLRVQRSRGRKGAE